MKVNKNESSIVNILYFSEFVYIAGLHIKIDTSKEKVINIHIKDVKIIHFKSFAEDLFYTNIKYPTMITNPNNVYLNAHSYISVLKQNSVFLTDSEIEGA